MCRKGMQELVSSLSGKDMSGYGGSGWSRWEGVELCSVACPVCAEKMSVIRKEFVGSAYLLPSRGFVQVTKTSQPCLALGLVKPGRVRGKPSDAVRSRWQGLMLRPYDLFFVDVVNSRVGRFSPSEESGLGGTVQRLEELAGAVENGVRRAREQGSVPVINAKEKGDSKATCGRLIEILSPVFKEYGYGFHGAEVKINAFWYEPKCDLVFKSNQGTRIAVEVKVSEDADFPAVGQPDTCLLDNHAVIGLRVWHGPQRGRPDLEGSRKAAVKRLEKTGRARFIEV